MGNRKVEIPVDYTVKEYLRKGKGDLTWDQYLTLLKRTADSMEKAGNVMIGGRR